MPKNIRYIEVATELSSAGKILYRQISFEELAKLEKGTRIRIFESKLAHDDDEPALLEGFIAGDVWSNGANIDITTMNIDIVKKEESTLLKKYDIKKINLGTIGNHNIDISNVENTSYCFTTGLPVINKFI